MSVARIMFIAGFFLLPWLWIANLLYFRKRILDKDAPPLLAWCASTELGSQDSGGSKRLRKRTPDFAFPHSSCFPSFSSSRPADLRRSAIGAAIMTVVFVAWVTVFQTTWRSWGNVGSQLLIWTPDSRWWLW